MKKLTDEIVAKALGWKYLKAGSEESGTAFPAWIVGKGQKAKIIGILPAWTKSLDAIVAEIEARGLVWAAANKGFLERGTSWATVGDKDKDFYIKGKTAPLALCAALLAYLKETK